MKIKHLFVHVQQKNSLRHVYVHAKYDVGIGFETTPSTGASYWQTDISFDIKNDTLAFHVRAIITENQLPLIAAILQQSLLTFIPKPTRNITHVSPVHHLSAGKHISYFFFVLFFLFRQFLTRKTRNRYFSLNLFVTNQMKF